MHPTIRRVLACFIAVITFATACGDDAPNTEPVSEPSDDDPSDNEEVATESESTGAESTSTAAVPCDAEPEVLTTADGVDFVRTPDACFEELPDWPYEPQYVEIDGLRQAYVDDGPTDGEVVLLLHGQPSWSYLYRDMIPALADAGYRVIAMDHLGMGRSDKPIERDAYSYLGHNDRLEAFIDELALADINLFVQDWGSVVGLRVAGLNPDLFATIAVGDGMLPNIPAGAELFPPVDNPDVLADIPSPFAAIPEQQVPFFDGCELLVGGDDVGGGAGDFGSWIVYSMTAETFHASEVVEAMTWFDLTPEEEAAYDAPFPSRIYMGGPRTFPSLVNEVPGETAEAWEGLMAFEKPFLTLWAANDPGNLGQCATQQNLIDSVPGAAGQPHDRLAEASHFLQDDQGTEIATRLVDWYQSLLEVGTERVGFELLQRMDDGTLRAWVSADPMTLEQFEAIELPPGWIKNQPRESSVDGGVRRLAWCRRGRVRGVLRVPLVPLGDRRRGRCAGRRRGPAVGRARREGPRDQLRAGQHRVRAGLPRR
ncbi:MAG: haloalkane dehalogenase [Acidimicrobiales bacterium]